MIVVDASVLATGLIDDEEYGDLARARLLGEQLVAPQLILLEVASVVRRQALAGRIGVRRAESAMADLADIPLQLAPHRRLLARAWDLRDNLTPYDAAYVALAELLDCVLLTADTRLSKAPGVRCECEVMTA